MKTFTKTDMIEALSTQLQLSKKKSAELIEKTFELMKKRLSAGDFVKLWGFGKFEVRLKKPRLGRNPKTKEAMMISQRKVVVFRASPLLKEAVRGGNYP